MFFCIFKLQMRKGVCVSFEKFKDRARSRRERGRDRKRERERERERVKECVYVCECVSLSVRICHCVCLSLVCVRMVSLSDTHTHTHTHTVVQDIIICCRITGRYPRSIQNEAHTKTRMRMRTQIVGRIAIGNVFVCVCASDSEVARIDR